MRTKMPVHVKSYKRFKNGKWEDVTEHYRKSTTTQLSEQLLKDVRQGKAIRLELEETEYQLPEYLEGDEEFPELWENLSEGDRYLLIEYLFEGENEVGAYDLVKMNSKEFLTELYDDTHYSPDSNLFLIDVNGWLEEVNNKKQETVNLKFYGTDPDKMRDFWHDLDILEKQEFAEYLFEGQFQETQKRLKNADYDDFRSILINEHGFDDGQIYKNIREWQKEISN